MSQSLPMALVQNNRLDRWVQVESSGTVAVRTGKVEIGQGILSVLAQMAADELDVAYARIRIIPADTGDSPDEGVTAGSVSVENSGSALRQACAEVRYELLQAAVQYLNAEPSTLVIEDGTIISPNGKRVTFWQLLSQGNLSAKLQREANACAKPKSLEHLKLLGQSLPRLDIEKKITGAAFLQDIELPGMLHARVARPPSPRAKLMSLDSSAIEAMPGVQCVVRLGHFLGVITQREEQAIAAAQALTACAKWHEDADLPDMHAVNDFLIESSQREEVLVNRGNQQAQEQTGISATFSRPYLSHGSIGPSCAIASWNNGFLEVWSHSQSIRPLRRDLGIAFGIPIEKIMVRHAEGAGCYGHNGADDVALDAALLARAVDGRPVRVQWSREDEFAWEPLGPAMLAKLKGAVGTDGLIAFWRFDLWSSRHIARPGRDVNPSLLAAWHLDQGFSAPPPIDTPFEKGGTSQRNAVPSYDIPNLKLVHHVIDSSPMRTSTIRGIGSHLNIFANESFMDELAHEAGADPVAFRLRHVSGKRERAVIEAAAEKAQWGQPMAVSDGDVSRGKGIGFSRYRDNGAITAVIAEVEISNMVRVLRVVTAIDCGRVVNPDGVINQVEGGIVQAVSWTIKEAVQFDRNRITSCNWEQYPILLFSELPAVEVVLIDQPNELSKGVGEVFAGPTAAAISNAIFDAIGIRVRNMPITAERLISLINQ